MTSPHHQDHHARNRRVALFVFLTVVLMVGLSFASVPLYNLFCRVTGFGGTTGVAEALPERVLDRVVTIKFDASTAQGMPWRFHPEERERRVRLGERGLTAYRAENPTDHAVTGTALYNVTPDKAGKYFRKIECFCFGEQRLEAGQSVSMPVVFFIDPALDDDPDMADVNVITLSYTFFETGSSDLDKALEGFYNQ